MYSTGYHETTYSGPYASMLAHGILKTRELFMRMLENDKDDPIPGYWDFSHLTLGEKIWTLHKIAFCLLDEKTKSVERAAYLEATIFFVFRQIEACVKNEINRAKRRKRTSDTDFAVRRVISAALEDVQKADGEEFEEGMIRIEEQCDCFSEWEHIIIDLEGCIFDVLDFRRKITPENASFKIPGMKKCPKVLNEYLWNSAREPKPSEIAILLDQIESLCNHVIEREKTVAV